MKAIGPSYILSIFYPDKLDLTLSDVQDYNWLEFQQSTTYDGHNINSSNIINFWKAFGELNQEQKINFLIFFTGTSYAPTSGLKKIGLTIHKSYQGLHVAHTCTIVTQTCLKENHGSKFQHMHHDYLRNSIIQKGLLFHIAEKKQNHFNLNFLLNLRFLF